MSKLFFGKLSKANSYWISDELLTAFSLIRNIKNFISVERDSGDIRTAHAIRFFNALMLVISHKCMAIFFNPYANRTAMSETMGNSWTVMGRAASLYTDPFLMISGMLTAYSLFGRLQRGGKINILKEYASRYLRIMPPLAFLIGFCTYILPLIGDGPQWNLVVGHHTGICKQYWWRNLLFIHNWFGFSNMCLTHTHHIGIDSELFVIAPFLILMLWKWPKKGTYVLISLGFLSTIARYYVTYTKNLSNYVFFGTRWTLKCFDFQYFIYQFNYFIHKFENVVCNSRSHVHIAATSFYRICNGHLSWICLEEFQRYEIVSKSNQIRLVCKHCISADSFLWTRANGRHWL